MRLIMLGLPAAGKGTQGTRLGETFGVPHISTGSMFREAIGSDTPVGREARKYIDRGELVPDQVAIEIVRQRITQSDCAPGYILDGFPRTVPQAVSLDRVLGELSQKVDAALNIQITEGEAIRRIAERRICAQCGAIYHKQYMLERDTTRCEVCGGPLVQRPDDNEATARNRLQVYLEQTHPLMAYYEQRGLLLSVDGEREIDAVYADLIAELVRAGVISGTSGVSG